MTIRERESVLPRPNAGVQVPYGPPRPLAPCDLWLAGNEGKPPRCTAVRLDGVSMARYPSTDDLAAAVAVRFDIAAERVLVTAGADDALLRIALAYLDDGREIVLPGPTFEMIPRYAKLAGGRVVDIAWNAGEPYPIDAVLAEISDATSVIMIVSPNNPTGAVATADDVQRVADAAPHALVVVDQAYAEFADEDLSQVTGSIPNAVLLRTMSKAYGCAGLRVGFVLGATGVVDVLRAAGNPYPVAAPSIAAATERLESNIDPFVSAVRDEREALVTLLTALGVEAFPSQGNFVFARTPRATEVRDLVSGLGIAIRVFPRTRGLEDALRITCPGDTEIFERLAHALRAVLAPDTLLFDMDGVLADVSGSFRVAVIEAAKAFGVDVTGAQIDAAKAAGGANDDWSLTQRFVAAAGVTASLDEVTARFEALYQGTGHKPGLHETESLLLERAALERLAARYRLGVVTGRPRSDATRFLTRNGIADLFGVVITRDDAPLKPHPAPVVLALQALGGTRAWMLGDTRDDIDSARAANVVPIGVVPPGGRPALREAIRINLLCAGAGVCLDRTTDLEEMLPWPR